MFPPFDSTHPAEQELELAGGAVGKLGQLLVVLHLAAACRRLLGGVHSGNPLGLLLRVGSLQQVSSTGARVSMGQQAWRPN